MDSNIFIWALVCAGGLGAAISITMRQRQKNKASKIPSAFNPAVATKSTFEAEQMSANKNVSKGNAIRMTSTATPSSHSDYYTVNLYQQYQSTGGIGVAFSGGGSRSLSCTLGQLRGLKYIDKLDQIDCIAAVSGGSWASSLYTYLPTSIDDDDFLGTAVLDPSTLTLLNHGDTTTALDTFSQNNMGKAATNLGVVKMAARAVELYVENGVPADELWVRMIGEYVFQPFDLFDLSRPKFFTKSLDWFHNEIAPNNPELNEDDFYIPKANRPELVVNFNLAPQKDSNNLFPMESTQEMAGILPSFPATPPMNDTDLGGGYIDPFGFGSKNQSSVTENTIKVVKPENRFSVHTASGLSSSAFSETLLQATKWPSEVTSIVPREYYWPVMNPTQPSQQYEFADGGNLEDTGIAALLRRQMKSVLAFVNTSTPISYDATNQEVVIGEQIAVLFGYQPKTKNDRGEWEPWTRFPDNYKPGDPLQKEAYATFAYNKVFNSDSFISFTEDLYNLTQKGGSVIWKMENVEVLEQAHLGVEAYTLDKLLWIYNSNVPDFNKQLEEEIQLQLNDLHGGEFLNFPYYDTILQLGLSTSQVNLLAHLSCWNIISDNVGGNPNGQSNTDIFKSMFD